MTVELLVHDLRERMQDEAGQRATWSRATAAATCPTSGAPSSAACATARSAAWSRPTRWSWASTSAGWRRRCSWATRARWPAPGSRWGAPGAATAARSPCWSPTRARSTSTWPATRSTCSRRTPEAALINPDNLDIRVSHLKAAAFELPFEARRGVRPRQRRAAGAAGRRRTSCTPTAAATTGWPSPTRPRA